MNRIWTILAVLALMVLLATCAVAAGVTKNTGYSNAIALGETFGYGLWRVADNDAGVVCWVYDKYYAAGIDCMPIEMTGLKQ